MGKKDYKIPYIKEEDYYFLTKNQKFDLRYLTIVKEGYTISIITSKKKIKKVMKENGNIKLLIYNKNKYKILNLKLTTLPILVFDDDIGESKFHVLNPYIKEKELMEYETYDSRYRIRGGSSRTIPKKSYKLNILKENGNKKKVSLLGLRKDNDYILNSMSFDNSKLREKIGYEIYKGLSNIQVNGVYAEVIIKDSYQGLYYLQEPMDIKEVKGNKKNDLLISVKAWAFQGTKTNFYDSNYIYRKSINEFEFNEGIEDTNTRLELLRVAYSNIFDKGYSSNIVMNYDLKTNIEYELFLNMISAVDNTYKNIKIMLRNMDENKYQIEVYPWDLDRSMYNINLNLDNRILYNGVMPDNLKQNPSYQKEMAKTYFKYRNTFYQMGYINNLIDSNVSLYEEGGSILRENQKWNIQTQKEDVSNVRTYFEQRMKILDLYYGGILWNIEKN